MELLIDLQFSEASDEFRHSRIDPATDVFRTVVKDIEYSEARRFIDWIRTEFPNPLLFVSVVCQYNAWVLKGKP